MRTSLDSDALDRAVARLAARPRRPTRADRPRPVHTLLVPASAFRADAAKRAGAAAARLLRAFAPDSVVLARALRLPGWETLPTQAGRADELLARLDAGGDGVGAEARLLHEVYRRVGRRLDHAPVQDLRIDLHEDRDADEREATAGAVGVELARAIEQDALPPRAGLRIPPLAGPGARGSLRALDAALTTLSDEAEGALPDLVITLADVRRPAQVLALAEAATALEDRLSLRKRTLRVELELASAEAVTGDGRVVVAELVAAAGGRCVGIRLDLEAVARSLGADDVAAASPVRDLVRLSLGAVPLACGDSGAFPQVDPEPNAILGADAPAFARVHAAWQATAARVGEAARLGFPWGWDRDAGQLPARLAAIHVALRQRLPRLREELAEAIGRGDDPVLGQQRLDAVLQGLDCGAFDAAELAVAGLEEGDLSLGSFRALADRRRV